MISPDARRILDQAGPEVAQALYVKQLKVSRLPASADDLVYFSGGQVRFGELDEWLREKDEQRDKRERSDSCWLKVATVAAVIGAIATAVFGYLAIAPRHVEPVAARPAPTPPHLVPGTNFQPR